MITILENKIPELFQEFLFKMYDIKLYDDLTDIKFAIFVYSLELDPQEINLMFQEKKFNFNLTMQIFSGIRVC